jgi:hypothetical protein
MTKPGIDADGTAKTDEPDNFIEVPGLLAVVGSICAISPRS